MALAERLRSLQTVRNDKVYGDAWPPPDSAIMPFAPVAAIRAAEGWTVIVEEARARQAHLHALFRCAWITPQVHADLAAVGLTAAVAAALRHADISCNVVAGACHDPLVVPAESADRALATPRARRQHSM